MLPLREALHMTRITTRSPPPPPPTRPQPNTYALTLGRRRRNKSISRRLYYSVIRLNAFFLKNDTRLHPPPARPQIFPRSPSRAAAPTRLDAVRASSSFLCSFAFTTRSLSLPTLIPLSHPHSPSLFHPLPRTFSFSLDPSLFLTLYLSPPLPFLSLIHSISPTLSLAHALSHSICLCLSHTRSHPLSLSPSSLPLSRPHSITLSLSHAFSFSPDLSLPVSRARSHPLSFVCPLLSLSLSLPFMEREFPTPHSPASTGFCSGIAAPAPGPRRTLPTTSRNILDVFFLSLAFPREIKAGTRQYLYGVSQLFRRQGKMKVRSGTVF